MRTVAAGLVIAVGVIAGGASAAPPTPGKVRENLKRIGVTVKSGDRGFRIPSSAMEPTLHCARPAPSCLAKEEDRIIARPYGDGRPRRGDIVVLETPPKAKAVCGVEGTFVKRVIGLPGESVHEDAHGFLYVNGKKLEERYIGAARRQRDVLNRNRTWRVPAHAYFALGDNRSQSCDS